MIATELLDGPYEALNLPENSFVVSAIVVVEYVEPNSENRPTRRRLAWCASDELNPWTSIGIWEFLKQHEVAAIAGFVEGTDGNDS